MVSAHEPCCVCPGLNPGQKRFGPSGRRREAGRRRGANPSSALRSCWALLAIQYLSQEWAEAALARVESDAEVRSALKGVKISILAIILGSPEGRYGFLYVAFDGTGLSEYRVGYDYDAVTKGLESPTFVVSGPYEVFASVVRGEITERKALMTGKLHLTGGLLRALRHMNAMTIITDSLNSIECET